MTDLTKLNIDPDVKENSGEFTILPEGKYHAVIISDEVKDNSSGSGKLAILELQVMNGEYKGLVLKDYINLINTNSICQQIGQGTLKRICNICDCDFPPSDSTKLYGKNLTITVKVESFVSKNTGEQLKSNKIKAYNPYSPDAITTTTATTATTTPEDENPW